VKALNCLPEMQANESQQPRILRRIKTGVRRGCACTQRARKLWPGRGVAEICSHRNAHCKELTQQGMQFS